MPLMQLTNENFDTVIDENEYVLLDFWAGWCQPCLQFAKTYEKVAQDYPDVVFGKIDVEAQAKLAEDFQIRSIPTLLVIRDHFVLFSESGNLPEDALHELIKQAKDVDIDKLKAELDKKE